MSAPAFVVMPVNAGDGTQHSQQETAKIAAAIQQSVYDETHPEAPEPEPTGPLKEILAHQDSLYTYISWEDPVRTLSSYSIALSILLGAHYLPLTQAALKIGAFTFGVISITEFVNRMFSQNTILARLRPKSPKQVPESILNATLKDIHDFVQYSVVQAQRIMLGQDLDKTFVAFLGFTALYWLVKLVSPLSLSIIGLTSLYIAPLVLSPAGREVAQNGKVLAGNLADAAVENGQALAQNGKDMARNVTAKAGDLTNAAVNNGQELAQGTMSKAGDLTNAAVNSGKDIAQNGMTRANDMTSAAVDNGQALAQNGSAKASELSSNVRDTASDTQQRMGDVARSGKDATVNRIGDVAQSGKQAADNLSTRAGFTPGSAVSDASSGTTANNYQSDATTGKLGGRWTGGSDNRKPVITNETLQGDGAKAGTRTV